VSSSLWPAAGGVPYADYLQTVELACIPGRIPVAALFVDPLAAS
jgi:hypothetical protein